MFDSVLNTSLGGILKEKICFLKLVPKYQVIWDKVFKSGQSKFCGRQILNVEADFSNFLKAVFHKIYSVHSWMLCPICRVWYLMLQTSNIKK